MIFGKEFFFLILQIYLYNGKTYVIHIQQTYKKTTINIAALMILINTTILRMLTMTKKPKHDI